MLPSAMVPEYSTSPGTSHVRLSAARFVKKYVRRISAGVSAGNVNAVTTDPNRGTVRIVPRSAMACRMVPPCTLTVSRARPSPVVSVKIGHSLTPRRG